MPALPAPEPLHGVTKDPIPALDGLRAIAVLLVLLEHVPKNLPPAWWSWAQVHVQPGYAGVDIFFVLSGFLITRIVLVDRTRGWPLRYFMARRLLRIFPILYLTLAVVWILRPGPELPWIAAYVGNYYFAEHGTPSPLAQTWSLAVEEHYYLLWPPLVYALGPAWARRVALTVLMPGAVAWAAWKTFDEPLMESRREIQVATQYRMLSLAAGSVLAWHEGWLRTRPRAAQLLGLSLGVAGYSVAYYGIWHDTQHYPAYWLAGFCAVSVGFLLLAIGGNGRRGPFDLLLRSRPMRRIGRISYGIYLYHVPIFWACGAMGSAVPPTWTRLGVALILSFAAAELSFALVERPILRLQRRFRTE